MGTVDVAGKPAELTATALSQIAANQTGTLGTLRILEKADNQITIQGVPSENPLESSSRHIQQGKLIFSNSMTGHTQVDYVVIVGNSIRVLLLVGALMQVLGLIAICTGFVLILTLVIPEPFPAIRWQTLQMMQVVHFLWPPVPLRSPLPPPFYLDQKRVRRVSVQSAVCQGNAFIWFSVMTARLAGRQTARRCDLLRFQNDILILGPIAPGVFTGG